MIVYANIYASLIPYGSPLVLQKIKYIYIPLQGLLHLLYAVLTIINQSLPNFFRPIQMVFLILFKP